MRSSKLLAFSLSLVFVSQAANAAQTTGSTAAPAPASTSPSENMAHPSELPESKSSNDPIPTAPKPVTRHGLKLIRQAGVGGPTAYARNGVLELGGQLSFASASNYKVLTFTPSAGYFITDNFQLSGLLSLNFSQIGGGKKTTLTAVVEPSIHLPLIDQAFVFAGLGLGVAYHQNFGTGFALAPRVGFNIMVGRSGVLTPAFNVNWSSNSASEVDGQRVVAVQTLLGASLGYSVMF